MDQLRFTHIGMGNVVCANRVIAIISPRSACGKRYTKTAKTSGRYIDATVGRTMKSLIIMDDGSVAGSAITSKTLMRRLSGENVPDSTDNMDDVEENEEDNTQEGDTE